MSAKISETVVHFSRRRRRWLFVLTAAGLSVYAVYKLHHHPSVARRRRKLERLISALLATVEAISLISSELNGFLRSDSDEIPSGLRQLGKVARSEELSGSFSRVSEAVAAGVVRGLRKAELCKRDVRGDCKSFSDRFLDRLFSASGSAFASSIFGSLAESLVFSFHSTDSGRCSGDEWPSVQEGDRGAGQLICDVKCRGLVEECLRRLVSSAVTVYLGKGTTIDAYDRFFAGLTNPKHEAKVKEILISVCNGAVETFVKTSHQVLTSTRSTSSGTTESINQGRDKSTAHRPTKVNSCGETSGIDIKRWENSIESVVRSLVDFLFRKLCEVSSRGVSVVRKDMVERGLDVMKYISAKSIAIFTICLTFCLQLSIRTRLSLPV